MLDLNYICENHKLIRKNLIRRGILKDTILDQIVALNTQRKNQIREVEMLRQTQNVVSKEIAKMKQDKKDASVADGSQKMAEMRVVSDKIQVLTQALSRVENDIRSQILLLPNVLHHTVPEGKNEDDNVEVKVWGSPPRFDFDPKSHEEIGKRLNIIDTERAAKISGARFTIYKNVGARLERALINLMLDINTKESGYEEIWIPFLVNKNAMTGTGQLPKFSDDLFKVEGLDFYLIPTSEVSLCNMYGGEILSSEMLPINLTAYSPCFRKEAGSYGKDVRGIIRQHQFNKVELVKIVTPESSYEELEKLTTDAQKILQRLNLPYRVVVLCSSDTGFSAAKTYDIEVWLPSEKRYREISSCSNCEDFQARRMNLRYRPKSKAKPEFPHILNGSALAVGRTLVAILENFQKKDGSVEIPKALVPYVGAEHIKAS